MQSLRALLPLAGMLLLPVAASAQASRIACKDGTPPKVGHFTCWGHGGVVSLPLKSAHAARSATAKPKAEKHTGKPVAKKPAASAAKKKAAAKGHKRQPTRHSAK